MTICPQCGKQYTPMLRRKDKRPIQEQYLDAPAWQREQLISGIGCQACWELYLMGYTKLRCTCG